MTSTLHHHTQQLEFQPRPVTHAPSPLGFGFGLSSANAFASTTGLGRAGSSSTSQSTLQHLASVMQSAAGQPSPQRVAKRRHDGDEDDARSGRDVTMDRSPTPPDRPKRAAPKRSRFAASGEEVGKDQKGKSSKSSEDDVDVGVLLASLPSSALLPIITSLLTTHPELKPAVISLIPRPTVDAAIQAVAATAKKLRDAYPYSNTSAFASTPTPVTTSSFFGFGSARPTMTTSWSSPSFGTGVSSGASNSASQAPSMRDDYVLSRLVPHITEFVSACMTYLPYFSNVSPTSQLGEGPSSIHAQVKEKAHPNETFQFLSAITTHLLSQPPLTRSALAPQFLPRLVEEWTAWINRVDSVVNREGGMFGGETVRQWERALDEYATAKHHGLEAFATLRNQWVASVGWLVGRQSMMQT